jgi:malonyl-CoA O-methyltransferase
VNVAAAFDRACDYDRYAHLQAKVARQLADDIATHPLAKAPRILEIGCGTGFLGAELVDRLEDASWLMTDVAPTMVARTAKRFAGRSDVRVSVMDGEHPDGEERYDLICSNLAMQWFTDTQSTVERLRSRLAPGGLLAFTMLAEGTFHEWRAAHGAEPGTPNYPCAAVLEERGLSVRVAHHSIRYENARAFLRALKKIGAGTPRPGYEPLRPAALKRVMNNFEAAGSVATYVVATCMARRDR